MSVLADNCYFVESQRYRVRLSIPPRHGGGLFRIDVESIIYIDPEDNVCAETVFLMDPAQLEKLELDHDIYGHAVLNENSGDDVTGVYWVAQTKLPVNVENLEELGQRLREIRQILRSRSLRRHPAVHTQSKYTITELGAFGEDAEQKLEKLGIPWRGPNTGAYRERSDMIQWDEALEADPGLYLEDNTDEGNDQELLG